MEHRYLGKTGLKVSELCLGAMTFGRETSEEISHGILDRFVEAGGNFIDTADVYTQGVSEEIVGRSHPRPAAVLPGDHQRGPALRRRLRDHLGQYVYCAFRDALSELVFLPAQPEEERVEFMICSCLSFMPVGNRPSRYGVYFQGADDSLDILVRNLLRGDRVDLS